MEIEIEVEIAVEIEVEIELVENEVCLPLYHHFFSYQATF